MQLLKKFNSLSVWSAVSGLSVGLLAAVAGVVATIGYEWRKIPLLWIFIAIAVAVFVRWANSRRDKSSIKWGTAYYLGVLLASMRDEHQLKFRKFKKETHYQDARAVTSKLEKYNSYGFDWVAEITTTAQRMQESMNEDDVSTGFSICPNLLMPAALGIGAQLYFPHDVEYIEMPMDSGTRPKSDDSSIQKYAELDREVVVFDKGRQKYQLIFNPTSGLSRRGGVATKSEGAQTATNIEVKTGKQQTEEEVPVKDWPQWQLPEFDGLLEEVQAKWEKVFEPNGGQRSVEQEPEKNRSSNNDAENRDDSPFELCITRLNDDGVLLITLEMGSAPGSRLAPLDNLKVHSRFSMEPKSIYSRVIMVGTKNQTPKWLVNLLKEEHCIKTDNNSKADDNEAEVTRGELDLLQKKTALATGEIFLRDSLVLLAAAEQYYYNNELDQQGVPIVLMMRMPKTTTVTIGQMLDLLNEKYRPNNRKIPSYWENLIIMNWEPSNTWRIARVHPAQKPLKEMYEALSRFGYSV